MKQRESEAEVLGRKLQLQTTELQTTELEKARKNCTIKEEVQQLLEQANMDIVRISSLVFVMNSIVILMTVVAGIYVQTSMCCL